MAAPEDEDEDEDEDEWKRTKLLKKEQQETWENLVQLTAHLTLREQERKEKCLKMTDHLAWQEQEQKEKCQEKKQDECIPCESKEEKEDRKNIYMHRLDSETDFQSVASRFKQEWKNTNIGADIRAIYRIEFNTDNSPNATEYAAYVELLKAKHGNTNEAGRFHGCSVSQECLKSLWDRTNRVKVCHGNCAVCGILRTGFLSAEVGSTLRFGSGFPFSQCASRAHEYPIPCVTGQRVMLECKLALGKEFLSTEPRPHLLEPPDDCDSVFVVGSQLNSQENVVYTPRAILPQYVIVYLSRCIRCETAG